MEVNFYKIYWIKDETPNYIGSTCKTIKEIMNFHLLISEYFNENNIETICSDDSIGIINKKYINFYNYMSKHKDSMKIDLLEKKILFKDEILNKIKENNLMYTVKNIEITSKEYRKIYNNEYRKNNKIKIYKARKLWIQKNKEIINCECGGKYNNHLQEKRKRHFNSKLHTNFFTNKNGI